MDTNQPLDVSGGCFSNENALDCKLDSLKLYTQLIPARVVLGDISISRNVVGWIEHALYLHVIICVDYFPASS